MTWSGRWSERANAVVVALGVAVLAVAGGAQGAGAQVLPGSRVTFSGVADATDLGTPGVRLDFQGPVAAATAGNTGSFATLNRSAGAAVTGPIADFTVGRGTQVVPGLLELGGYRFTLLGLPSGPFGQSQCYVAPAVGQRCTPFQSELGRPVPTDPLSPFYLTNVASGNPAAPIASVVSFNLFGLVTGPRGGTSGFFGTITSVLPLSYQEVLGGLEFAGGFGQPLPGVPFTGVFYAGLPLGGFDDGDDDDDAFVWGAASTDAYAAEYGSQFAADATVTPEPATVALLGAGLAAAGLVARRRRQG